ncbi:MAG: BREX system P-loop protein BrxC [Candidatus Viridilinea halotolerans]|uniref:BREX system P-loop protein BrxC n=1 Tax=Candidatus Viridilinea halotolerans TaxID=2491704 RepID=A0A426U2S1_9CHLR|nr:MAG: BREX system P-loop protein BrxC [Candidatus Viridilinea halotolerans]
MQIVDTFATRIGDRIEPVVKVADRNPERMSYELSNLVVTPQWEQHVRRLLDSWAEASSHGGGDPGIWISGFFGSGKSLLLKVLGLVLQGGELCGEAVHDLFLERIPATSRDRSEIQRLLAAIRRKTTTTAVGGNIHALEGSSSDSLALIAFKLFAAEQGYTKNWPLAWGVEYYIDQAGKKEAFQRRAEELTGKRWARLQRDTAFNIEKLFQAAADVLPEHFENGRESVERTVQAVTQTGMTPDDVVERFANWCRLRDGDGRRHRLLLQLDELGQWIAGGESNQRIMQVQALVETAAILGEGRVWVAVTAHGDIQALEANVEQEQYAKINQRFSQKVKLSNDDMSHVVEARLLQKTTAGRTELASRFAARPGQITDLGSVKNAQRVYPQPTEALFPKCYPYLPWMIDAVPDIVKGIAQAAGRGDAMGGATRTMIAVVQGAILDTPDLLAAPIGRLLNLVDLYPQLLADVPVETKTDLNSIPTKVINATSMTPQVAMALYLLGQAKHIPCTPENVARALVTNLDDQVSTLATSILPELQRLVQAGYVKPVGETFEFLTTQQRSFQDKVRELQQSLRLHSLNLSQALKEFEHDDMFQLWQLQAQGRQLKLKLLMDGRTVQPGQSRVTVHILSPFQRTLDPTIADDEALRQRSIQEPETFFVRLDEVSGLRDTLALLIATKKVADDVIDANSSSTQADVAREVKVRDVGSHQTAVRNHLRTALRGAQIFFRGSSYYPPSSAGDAVRTLITTLLPQIYSRIGEVSYRLVNVEGAVKAALNGNFASTEIQLLNVLNSDRTLNVSTPLLSAVRGAIPSEHADRPPVDALVLRKNFEDPPFGWDGGAVQVALALLLRAGLCKLVVEGRMITDPHHPDAYLSLSRDQPFRRLRLLGMRTELETQQVVEARGFYETLFGEQPSLVVATLNNAIEKQMEALNTRCAALQQWATVASFPLPTEFTSGLSVVNELLASPTPVARIPLFSERHQQILALLDLLDVLEAFRTTSGSLFQRVRDYFHSMINAGLNVPELQAFLRDFNTLQSERRFYDQQRWQALVCAHESAESSVAAQLTQWLTGARQRADEALARIPEQLRTIGASEAQVASHASPLGQPFEQILSELSAGPTVGTASQLAARLDLLELNLRREYDRLREVFNPPPPLVDTSTTPIIANDVRAGPVSTTVPSRGNDTSLAQIEETSVGSPRHHDDVRAVFLEQIRARQGQKEYRDRLLAIFGNRCLISGCSVIEALEAAHINPYSESRDHSSANGLILRADLHTLFDLGMLAIDTRRRCVVFKDDVGESYKDLKAELQFPDDEESMERLRALDEHREECGL